MSGRRFNPRKGACVAGAYVLIILAITLFVAVCFGAAYGGKALAGTPGIFGAEALWLILFVFIVGSVVE